MIESPFKFHTRLSPDEAQKHTKVLVDTIKAPILQAGVGTEINLSTVFPLTTVNNPYPIIVILNGVGGSGKGTFASMVAKYAEDPILEISVVDPLREIADKLIHTHVDNYIDLYKDRPKTSDEHAAEKSDQWRSLMHDLKMSWQNLDDGPNLYCLGQIIRMVTVDNKDEIPGIIFVNIREEENINRFKDYCHSMGLICFSLLIDGKIDSSQFTNEGDALVNTFEYDVTIPNKGNLDDLSITAFIFYKFINRANHMYGVGIEEDDKATLGSNTEVTDPPDDETTTPPNTVGQAAKEDSSGDTATSFLHKGNDTDLAGSNECELQSEDHNRNDTTSGSSSTNGD